MELDNTVISYTEWQTEVEDGDEDCTTFWREERVQGAVYNVYLKKVKYYTLSDIHEVKDSNDCGHAHLQWRTQRIQVIKAGNLDRLVEAIAKEDGEMDSTYVQVFLATYRSFASPKQLLNLTLQRFQFIENNKKLKQQVKEAHMKTIRTVISIWLDMYPEDFRDPPNFPCLTSLQSFTKTHMPDSDLATKAEQRMTKALAEEESPVSPDGSTAFQFSMCDDVDFMMGSDFHRMADFFEIPDDKFAEQLTYIDAELFKKVLPHHCLGSEWSRRDSRKALVGSVSLSVVATVNQFNALSHRVIATVLKNPLLRPSERAKVIEKWINISQELRLLKNFTSLKSILSGLQSNPVYRLRKVWAEIDSYTMSLYEEQSKIFSEENNQMSSREILMKEGTAKFSEMEISGTYKTHGRKKSWGGTVSKRRSAVDMPSVAQGTVPYLGTFLTDLMMIDTAMPDVTEDGLINFDKKRKEFEVMAQIRLLQSAAQMYHITPDPAFSEWFNSIRVYDDTESYELSCDIEPVTPTTPKVVKGHKKKTSLGFFTTRRLSVDMLDSSVNSAPAEAASTCSLSDLLSAPTDSHLQLRHSVSVTTLRSMESDSGVPRTSPFKTPDTRAIKVSLETEENHWTNMYKSILLSNSDHTRTVIKSALIKYAVEGKPEDYCICQILPDKELQIPDKANVFYAMNATVPEFNFAIRKKSDLERMKLKKKGRHRRRTAKNLHYTF